ncbi:MAG: HD domain-containing protein [Planctomycetota bacterium]|nr:HD domain-containing protein [Planctomycetota bacterium]
MRLSDRFQHALLYAAELHANQLRRGGEIPYLAHLLNVAGIALDYGANENQAIAALLHDAVEDQGGSATAAEIRRRFGDEVAELVLGCTDCDTVPKPAWKPRKEAFVAKLQRATPGVALVVAADKLHNVRSLLQDFYAIGNDLWSRFNGGREGTLWYYRAVADAVQQGAPAALAAELDRAVQQLEKLARENPPAEILS